MRILSASLVGVAMLPAACASSPPQQTPASPPPQQQLRPVDIGRQRALRHQLAEDDQDTTHKIVGGKVAKPGKFPFQVALISASAKEDEEYFGQFCGGTLIDQAWVLTAAHCVPNTAPEELDVYVGAQELPRQAPGTGHRIHTSLIRRHQYDAKTNDNDIALIKLLNPPGNLTPATIATPEIATTVGVPSTNLTVIGWGRIAQSAHGSSELREVDVTVQDSSLCQANYHNSGIPSLQNTVISGNRFCAGQPEGGKDSCRGDSGGFIGAPQGQGWVGVGVVSVGGGCAQPGLFGIYTRVASYADWIKNTIKAN